MRNGAWLHHQELIKTSRRRRFQRSRGRSKAEHLCQVCKLGAYHPERSLKQWPPHPRPPRSTSGSCLFSNIHCFKR